MNFPSKSSSANSFSKSWDSKMSLRDAIHYMDTACDADARDLSHRFALDPFTNNVIQDSENNFESVIHVRKQAQRRFSLGDALGPKFSGKSKEDCETVGICSPVASSPFVTKKRNNICSTCGTTDTPSWRRSRDDKRYLLCNACGLRNRGGKKRHKGDSAYLPNSLHDGACTKIHQSSPLSPQIQAPVNSNYDIFYNMNNPLDMFFRDDLSMNNR